MAKRKKCPVSGKACIDCNLYIGRHYYSCLADEDSREYVDGKNASRRRFEKEHDDGTFRISEFDLAPKAGSWYHNIEDIYLQGEG